MLANDTLANQPPLTFFRGLVVDDEETESAHLDIVRSALQPLTDVGRVFALDQGAVEQTSTWERFDQAARHLRLPVHQHLFEIGDVFNLPACGQCG